MDLKAESKIYIIESPSLKDLADGRQEGGGLREFLTMAGIKSDYYNVGNTDDFVNVLESISADVTKNKSDLTLFMIHLSLHGSTEGIGLTSGEFIDWRKFASLWFYHFTERVGGLKNPTNGRMFCPVYLSFSVCEGLSAREIKRYSQHEPYFALVAPSKTVNWADSLIAFAVLYHTVLHKKSGIGVAVERMNLINELDNVFQIDLMDGWKVIK